jgi:K+-transporting ATPase ATPase A chain
VTAVAVVQLVVYMGVLTALAWPLGLYMARIYQERQPGPSRLLLPLERGLYRLGGVDPKAEMGWQRYAVCLLAFSAAGIALLYGLQRWQGALPVNPARLPAVPVDLAINTAVSFATNTNWQAYAGETTMSHLTQMLGMTVQNFLSAAAGMAVLAALIRGLARRSASTVGNFWVDLVRGTLYVLLPLSLAFALILVSQGVVQTFAARVEVRTLEGGAQILAIGPVASQVAIKQLGTNGGGYFGTNSSHPFEDPTPLSGFLETLAILLIPAALCFTFGEMVQDRRQGWAMYVAMAVVLVAAATATMAAEQAGNPRLAAAGVEQRAHATQSGGSMEGKEVRFGITGSALWATATTAASNGSVNSMHDSYTPAGGSVPLFLILLGEVIFGGVGSGLYGMLLFVIMAVFVSGLLVGRTPEYLGKKIEAFEMKMATLAVIVPAVTVLVGAALAVASSAGRASIANPGPHGFSEVLYAFASAGNNNGSAFAGLAADTPFYNLTLAGAMLVGRFAVALPALAVAGSLVRKRTVPPGPGTLATHTPLFIAVLVAIVLVVGALTFLPALALGPIAEQLALAGR